MSLANEGFLNASAAKPGAKAAAGRGVALDRKFAVASGVQGLFRARPQVLVDAAILPIPRKDVAAADELMKKAGELDPTFFFPATIQGWARRELHFVQ